MDKKRTNGQTFSRRLQSQLMVVFMVTITLLVGIVSIFNYKRSEKVIQEQASSLMQQYFQQNQYSITRYTKEIEKLLRLLMVQDDLQDYMRQGWNDQFESIQRSMRIFGYTNTLMGNYEYLDSVYYYGNDGTALGVVEKKNMVTQKPNLELPWYTQSIQEEALNNPGKVLWFGGYTNQDLAMEKEEEEFPYVTAVGSVWLGTGRYVVVVVNIRQNTFADLFTKSDSPDARESYLLDDEGMIVVHQKAEMVGKWAGFTPQELKEAGGEYLMKEDIQINYHKMEKLPWTIVSEIPKDSLYGSLVSLKQWFVVLAGGGLLVAFALSAYSLYRLTAPLNRLRAAMERMENGSLGEQLDESSKNELGMLGRQFNRMSKSIHTMIEQIREMEEEKRMLEKEALQSQLNPHFLFNTLSNMRFMAKLGQNKALEESFGALGRMLQPMYRSEGELWSLRQEVEYMSNYITIMNCRFGGKLSIEYEIPETLMELQVLKFILQPLVENAVEHGFVSSGSEGLIVMGAERKEQQLKMYVEDNGRGIPKKEQQRLFRLLKKVENQKELYKNHVGIINVHRRLKVHFGETYGIQLESVPGKSTCIYLVMPIITGQDTRTPKK